MMLWWPAVILTLSGLCIVDQVALAVDLINGGMLAEELGIVADQALGTPAMQASHSYLFIIFLSCCPVT